MLYYVLLRVSRCFTMLYYVLLRALRCLTMLYYVLLHFVLFVYLYVELSECTFWGGFRVSQKAKFYAFIMNNKVLL